MTEVPNPRALCNRYHLEDVASVLEEWLTQRGSLGTLAQKETTG